MEKSEVTIKLTEIFRNVFKNQSIELYDSLSANDINNWDSLTHMVLITEVERTFAIKFKLKDINKMRNVGDLIGLIQSKLVN
jgi:acyl carrier protein